MRINDLVKIVSTNELGVLVEIVKEEGFSDEYVVEINGKHFCCFEAELEVLDV
jgi:hypothetical protein